MPVPCNLTADLTAILDAKRVLHAPEDLLTYGFDGTAALSAPATCVALPETTEEVASVMRYAAEHRVPIVTRGSGTGLSGGSVPVPGGMCLPTCPTYVETKLERKSPRGRIALMRRIADGKLGITEAFGDEMYFCLGCRARCCGRFRVWNLSSYRRAPGAAGALGLTISRSPRCPRSCSPASSRISE